MSDAISKIKFCKLSNLSSIFLIPCRICICLSKFRKSQSALSGTESTVPVLVYIYIFVPGKTILYAQWEPLLSV
jgi:hypothetical protein